ncbi:sodium/proton antiporter, CPA1 family (TC 2.A.36) [Cetobacterium ceti]|uniref:Sodium/proton antiporter, CPA1 family (TC 2.A.36) n=1 Tax=Cetobacterium ceti TaxID=180163 RepID=A0A1T4LHJ6_9FUSO|nr:cation:proton antiporter [Cetobacterium ceti]SJZ54017.1 sodium/proton antiporter, CPA1 family (TC 2.A.36) [Cetobacterium ceti]
MDIVLFFIWLFLLGMVSNFGGKILEYIKLPSLIGMILAGMILGPAFFNFLPETLLKSSSFIKDLALVTVLFIGGLGISKEQMKRIGKPAILLSSVPALLEGFTIGLLSMILLDFTFIQGCILGFIIAAVSPAVLIPAMVDLIEKRRGENKAIPQLLLVGASADDTIAITLFTTFLSLYLTGGNNISTGLGMKLLLIPLSIIFSIFMGYILGFISKFIIKKINNNYLKTVSIFFICILMRGIEKYFHLDFFNSLLSIMIFGFYIRNNLEEDSKNILKIMNGIWKYGKLYLFSLVGVAINPKLVISYFAIGVLILIISLSVRSVGVLISLIGTDLNLKERLFCVIAYLPKATVQSAKSGIPLEMGVAGGDVMEGIAILSVLITAPIGAIGIRLTKDKFLYYPGKEIKNKKMGEALL